MAWHSVDELHGLAEQVIKAAVDAVCEDMNHQMDAISKVQQSDAHHQAQYSGYGSGGEMPSVAEVTNWANTEFGYIKPLFGGFGNGGPELSEPARNDMWSIVGALDPTFKAKINDQGGDVTSVMPTGSQRWRPDTGGDPNITVADRAGAMSRRLEYWRGTASDNFNSNFVVKVPSKAEMQKSVAATLATCIEAEQRIRLNANNDAWRTGQATIKLLESMSHPCQGSTRAVAGGLTVFSALASVLAATGGVGLALAGLGLASTAANSISSSAPHRQTVHMHGENARATISGGSVVSVMSSMGQVLQRVINGVSQQERDLSRVINDISLNVRDDEMTIPAPNDVTGSASHSVATLEKEDPGNRYQFSPS